MASVEEGGVKTRCRVEGRCGAEQAPRVASVMWWESVTGCDSYGRDRDEADVRRIAVDELIRRYDGQST